MSNLKFNSILEVLNDVKCKRFVQDKIDNIRRERMVIIKKAKAVSRLKSNAFSTLDKLGRLGTDQLIKEFILIDLKRSTLPFRERIFISDLVTSAMKLTLNYYSKLPTTSAAKKLNIPKVKNTP